jgi:hypothetical protein
MRRPNRNKERKGDFIVLVLTQKGILWWMDGKAESFQADAERAPVMNETPLPLLAERDILCQNKILAIVKARTGSSTCPVALLI